MRPEGEWNTKEGGTKEKRGKKNTGPYHRPRAGDGHPESSDQGRHITRVRARGQAA